MATLSALEAETQLLPRGMSDSTTIRTSGSIDETDVNNRRTVTTVDLASPAREDLKARREQASDVVPSELANKAGQILSAPDLLTAIQLNGGSDDFMGRQLHPGLLKKAQESAGFRAQLVTEYVNANKGLQLAPDQPPVPFEEGLPPELTEGMSTEFIDVVNEVVQKNVRLRNVMGTGDPAFGIKGKRMILSLFSNGEAMGEYYRTIAGIGGDVLRTPYIFPMIGAAAKALYGASVGEQQFQDALPEIFNQEIANSGLIKAMEPALNKGALAPITADRITRFQNWYKRNYIRVYGEQAYKEDHTSPMYTYDDQGNLTYDRDDDGVIKTMEVPLPRSAAAAILELSHNELPFIHKAGKFFLEQAPFTGGILLKAGAVGKKNVNRIAKARTENPDDYPPEMSDFDVLQKLKERDFRDATNPFLKTFFGIRNAALLGTGGYIKGVGKYTPLMALSRLSDKSSINVGNTLFEQATIVQNYDDQIADITGKIAAINQPASGKVAPNAAKRIETLESARNTLVKARDAQKDKFFKNPFLLPVLRDEALIATAMAAGQEFFPDMSVKGVDGEIIIGITAPLFTTGIVSASVGLTRRVGDMVSEGTLTDVAMFLEGTDFLPFLSPGDLIRGDERALRNVLNEQGLSISDERVKAFTQFSKILQTIRPEMREKVYQSLVNYNLMMDGFRTDLLDLGKTPEAVEEMMGKLQLSVATASGLAPLIAYQQGKAVDVTGKSLTRRNDMNQLIQATVDQESLGKGIDTNLQIIREMLAQDGVEIDSNSSLAEFIGTLEDTAVKIKGDAFEKKQALVLLLDNYIANIATVNGTGIDDLVDEDTIEELRFMAQQLEDASILPGGTVERILRDGERVESIALGMAESAEKLSGELIEFAGAADRATFKKQSRRAADLVFDVAAGRRRSLVSIEYNKADDMLPAGFSFDLGDIVKKFATLTGELDNRPLREQVDALGGFMRSNKPLMKSFNKMAKQGILEQMGLSAEGMELIIRSRKETDPDFDHISLALEMMADRPEDFGSLKLFSANFNDTESLYRYFDIQTKTNPDLTMFQKNELNRQFKGIINGVYEQIDLGDNAKGAFFAQVKLARETHAKLVGNRFDPDTYGATVQSGRGRKNPDDIPPGGETHRYKNINRTHPEVPFLEMGRIASKMLNVTKGSVEYNDLKRQLKQEQDRVLYFLGAKRVGEDMVFDLRDPRQAATLRAYNKLVTAHVNFAIAEDLRAQTQVATQTIAATGSLGPPSSAQAMGLRRAVNILDLESVFTSRIINSDGADDTLRGVSLNELSVLATDFDDLIKTNVEYQTSYKNLRAKVDPVKGVLGVAAKEQLSEMDERVRKLTRNAELANRKDAFWDMHFKNLTAENYQTLVQRFIDDSGMERGEVEKALKYMYVEGLLEKSKRRKYISPDTAGDREPEIVQDLDAIEGFVDILSTPEQRQLANTILGEKHANALLRMNDWVNKSMGNALNFRRGRGVSSMSIDSVFSRIFNIARGMVSPLYVGTEVATRALLVSKNNLLDLALSDRGAAEIMAKILTDPEALTPKDVKTLGILMEAHLARELQTSGADLPTLEQMIAQTEEEEQKGSKFDPDVQAAIDKSAAALAGAAEQAAATEEEDE